MITDQQFNLDDGRVQSQALCEHLESGGTYEGYCVISRRIDRKR